MSTVTYLPAPKEVRDLLADLLGKDVTLSPTSPLAPAAGRPVSVAVYVDDLLVVRAVIACDLAFSAYAGAAIALMPPTSAEAALEDGTLDETLRANLYEVLNIAASLFNVPDAPHVRLYDLHPAGGPVPPDVLAKTLTLGRREDLAVEIAGYGSGRLSVVLVQ
jgi:hypothetical protein